MTENEILKDLQNYQGILKAKTRINAGVNPEIALNAVTEAIDIIEQYRAIGTVEDFKALKNTDIPIIHGKAELDLHDKEVRNKAIDEFAEVVGINIIDIFVSDSEYNMANEMLKASAEQLKGEQNNE